MIFQQNRDSLEDGVLHAFEISDMNISSELVVLSACETGYGVVEKGEGVMSLARAFTVAGATSVVMSHWQVDDKITKDLMTHFYRYLDDGLSKDHALRKAKLNIIEENDQAISHPYYWAAFVFIGVNTPISFKTNQSDLCWRVLGFIALLLIAFTIWKGKYFRN